MMLMIATYTVHIPEEWYVGQPEDRQWLCEIEEEIRAYKDVHGDVIGCTIIVNDIAAIMEIDNVKQIWWLKRCDRDEREGYILAPFPPPQRSAYEKWQEPPMRWIRPIEVEYSVHIPEEWFNQAPNRLWMSNVDDEIHEHKAEYGDIVDMTITMCGISARMIVCHTEQIWWLKRIKIEGDDGDERVEYIPSLLPPPSPPPPEAAAYNFEDDMENNVGEDREEEEEAEDEEEEQWILHPMATPTDEGYATDSMMEESGEEEE